uniref:Dihydrolipoamide acetyltransferase component of pyruvate dehydrogenase complex n=1 Tax=Zea mays TaxID=4577 RepID=B6U9U3_MAIZE|nr:dihydrolipoyllysine-residue acetyltransferase component of pyruvatedehydrogenase complex [Zea mays]|eukprot:NP_001152158.1 dihydrolipoyllysine-residue acetyltransferase component of pyruvatedehydrogenase complex [Zea mays]
MASLIPPCLSVPTAPGRARLAAPGAPRRRRMAVVRAKIREIFMPALSSTMMEGKIVSWTAAEGDRVGKGDPVVVVESDKADMDVETFHYGIVAVVLVPAGGTAPVGAPIALLAESEEEVALARARAQALSQGQSQAPSPPHAAAALGPPPPAPVAPPATKGIATPYAKKLAKQHRVDIAGVVGTGPHGRVTAADVEAAAGIKHKRPPPPPPPASVDAAPLVPASAVLPPVPGGTVVPFTTMQAAVSKNMVESLRVPTFRVSYSMITDKLDALYEKVKSKGVTKTVLLVKAAAVALTQHPVVNASCRDGKSFSYNNDVNIGVAVALEGGLLTPVLEDADKMDIYLLARKWRVLLKKARMKQLQPNEYNSGTFTLSNLGMFGVDKFDAILPAGQGAIMAVGASRPTVVADKDGFFSIKSEMLVNVTADHRIIYGADLAAFLQTFAKIVEDPECLTL